MNRFYTDILSTMIVYVEHKFQVEFWTNLESNLRKNDGCFPRNAIIVEVQLRKKSFSNVVLVSFTTCLRLSNFAFRIINLTINNLHFCSPHCI